MGGWEAFSASSLLLLEILNTAPISTANRRVARAVMDLEIAGGIKGGI